MPDVCWLRPDRRSSAKEGIGLLTVSGTVHARPPPPPDGLLQHLQCKMYIKERHQAQGKSKACCSAITLVSAKLAGGLA